MKLPQSAMRRTATAMFAITFLAIPVALLTTTPIWVAAAGAAFLSLCLLLLSFTKLPRVGGARNLAKGFLYAALILCIIHFSGILNGFYHRYGWLILDMERSVQPAEVSPRDLLTYRLETLHPGPRAALQRRYDVDGESWRGVLMYGHLPSHDGMGFVLDSTPVASLEPSDQDVVYTVIYAELPVYDINPGYWEWSSTYTEGWEIVGVITSNGEQDRNLEPGQRLSLQYSVIVPEGHPERNLRGSRAALSYRDPSWATYYVQDLRFRFDETVRVVHE